MLVDITTQPLGEDADGNPVMLKDIWPSNEEIRAVVDQVVTPNMYASRYANVFDGTPEWQEISAGASQTFDWDDGSTYVRNPPYFNGMSMEVDPSRVADIHGARMLALLGIRSPPTIFPLPAVSTAMVRRENISSAIRCGPWISIPMAHAVAIMR